MRYRSRYVTCRAFAFAALAGALSHAAPTALERNDGNKSHWNARDLDGWSLYHASATTGSKWAVARETGGLLENFSYDGDSNSRVPTGGG